MITIKYEIQYTDLFGGKAVKIEERQFNTDDTVLAMRIFKDLKASQDVKYIEITSK